MIAPAAVVTPVCLGARRAPHPGRAPTWNYFAGMAEISPWKTAQRRNSNHNTPAISSSHMSFLLLLLTPQALTVGLGPLSQLNSHVLSIGELIATGSFGSVHWAQLGAKRVIAKKALPGARAAEFLSIEEHAARSLRERAGDSLHVARFVGACDKEGERTLVWHASSSTRTLDTYLDEGAAGRSALASALRCDEAELPRVVLRQLCVALAHVQQASLVHRDIKPANFVVDEARGALVLIDFGSSCDLGGWVVRRGHEVGRVPASVLYCPPEQLLDASAVGHPWGYDMYSAALIWLRVAVGGLGESEEALYEWRMQLKRHSHCPIAWREECRRAAGGVGGAGEAAALPRGWDLHLGDDEEGSFAWRLVSSMLASDPAERPCAAHALIDPYLNDCTVQLAPPARPWSIEAMAGSLTPGVELQRRAVLAEECAVDGLLEEWPGTLLA